MFRLEHKEWIPDGDFPTQEEADREAKKKEEAGYQTRVIFEGKIVRESAKE